MLTWILITIIALLLFGWVSYAWYNWRNTTQFSEADEYYDKGVISLNDRQANRLSDNELTRPIREDDAWQIMVQRGRQSQRNRRSDRRYPQR
jgi:hypothetical protein